MASTTVTLTMTRGDSQLLAGTLTPATGRTFSTPISALRFVAREYQGAPSALMTKTVGDGVSISSQSSTAIAYTVTLDPEDTAALPALETALVWDLELTEADGWKSTPVGGILCVRPDVAT